jgi:hypothetical protein
MVDVHSPRKPLTVHLSAELIEELHLLAREKNRSVDEVIMEACLNYLEPYTWEREYKAWRRNHPNEVQQEFGIDGDEIGLSESGGSPA